MTVTLSESARLLNQFQDRIDMLNNEIRVQMLRSLEAQQIMREYIIKRDELTHAMRVVLQETQT